VLVYVFYRVENPDNATQQEVQTILKEKNINNSQLVDNPANYCSKVESEASKTYLLRPTLPGLTLTANVNILG
jgi:hypothetical protein